MLAHLQRVTHCAGSEPRRHIMREDSPGTRTAMVLIFMGLVVALAAVLFVMIVYGYGETSGPGGFPPAQGEGRTSP